MAHKNRKNVDFKFMWTWCNTRDLGLNWRVVQILITWIELTVRRELRREFNVTCCCRNVQEWTSVQRRALLCWGGAHGPPDTFPLAARTRRVTSSHSSSADGASLPPGSIRPASRAAGSCTALTGRPKWRTRTVPSSATLSSWWGSPALLEVVMRQGTVEDVTAWTLLRPHLTSVRL